MTYSRTLPKPLAPIATILFAALVLTGLQPVQAAHAITPYDLTVALTTSTGAPLNGANVSATRVADHHAVGVPVVASPGPGGRYTLSDLLVAQDYALYFDAPASATTTFDHYYGGTTTIEGATLVSYTEDTLLSVSVSTNAIITGKITNSANKAVAGAKVVPVLLEGSVETELPQLAVTTSSSGTYSLTNLAPGSYRVRVMPANASGYLPAASAAISVPLGTTKTFSTKLAIGATIVGSVAGVLSGVIARAYPFASGSVDTTREYVSVPSVSGKWSVAGLPAGTYAVKLAIAGFTPEWANDAATLSSATTFTVNGTQKVTTGLTTLAPQSADNAVDLVITKQTGGAAVSDSTTKVYVFSADGQAVKKTSGEEGFVLTGGSFHFPYLPTGTYTVMIDPGDPALQPSISTQSVNPAAGADTWSVALPDASAFQITAVNYGAASAAPKVGGTWIINSIDTTATPGADIHYSYIWLRDGVPIDGAKSAAYKIQGADYGHDLTLLVRADLFGYPATFSTVNVPSTTLGDFASTFVSVTSSGTQWGSVLTAHPGSDIPVTSFEYNWFRDSTAGFPIGTGRTYTTVAADAEHELLLVLTAISPGRPPSNAFSSGFTPALRPSPVNTKAPSATSAIVGGDLVFTGSGGTWSPAITPSFSWYVNGQEGEFAAGKLICDADGIAEPNETDCGPGGLGTAIELSVFGSQPGFPAVQKRVVIRKSASLSVTPGITVPLTISDFDGGNTEVGQDEPVFVGRLLTADDPILDFPGSGSTEKSVYQWQISSNGTDFTNLVGKTGTLYTPLLSQVGKYLRVKVTMTSNVYGGTYEYTQRTGLVSLRTDLVDAAFRVELSTLPSNRVAGNTLMAIMSGAWPLGLSPTNTLQWFTCDAAADCSVGAATDPLSSNWKLKTGTTPLLNPASGEITSTFATSSADVDNRVLAQLTSSKPGFRSYVQREVYGPLVSSAATVYINHPSIVSGTADVSQNYVTVGTPVVFKAGRLDDPAAVVHGQWNYGAAGSHVPVDIVGATGLSYTPTGDIFALSDGVIEYVQTVTSHGHTTMFNRSFGMLPGTNVQTTAGKVDRFVDNPSSGQTTFTASPGTWKVLDSNVSYHWYVEGATVGGTGPALQIPSTTQPVYVDVTVSPTGYTPVTRRIVAQKGLASQVTSGSSIIFGDPGLTVGSTLDISESALWTFPVPDGVAYTYQWLVGTTVVGTGEHLVLTSALLDKAVKVKVTATSPLYPAIPSFTSAPVTITAGPPVTGSVGVTPAGSKPGTTIKAVLTGFPSRTTFTYLWQATLNGTDYTTVSTTSTYRLAPAFAGAGIRVTVTAKRPGYTTSSITSSNEFMAYTGDIGPSAPAVLNAQLNAPIGSPLTAASSWNTASVVLAYTWYRNDAVVPGATASTYTPPAGSFGDEVYAVIKATRAGYFAGTTFTNSVIVGLGAVPTASTKPVISGMTGPGSPKAPLVGNTLIASTPAWNVDGLAFTYIWKINGVDVIQSGADNTLHLTGNIGDTITVTVMATRDGWATGSALSIATKPVASAP